MSQMHGLGKGIRALIPEGTLDLRKEEVTRLPLSAIRLNRFQPRKDLNQDKIHELANSIRESGLIYPLLVRKINNSGVDGPGYELIAGERRYRALQFLGEPEAPVVVKEASDRKALEISLIENIQREELNPIESATAYQRLGDEFGLTQEQIATAVGKDRATVANTLRLLKLAPSVREEVARGRLTLGHARALLSLESQRTQQSLAQRIVAKGLSVRAVEQIVRVATEGPSRARSRGTPDPHLVAAQERLRRVLGTKVDILHGKKRGWIRISYYSLKDLDRLLAHLTAPRG